MVGLYNIKHRLVIGIVVFLLRAPALKVPGPELLVIDLVDGEDDEVEVLPPALAHRLELRDGVALDAELEAAANGELGGIALACICDSGEIALIVHVGDGLSLLDAR